MTEIDPNQIQSTASTAASAAGSASNTQEAPKEEENYFVEEQKKAEEQAQEQARAEEQAQQEADRQAAQEALEQAQKEAEEAARKAAEEAARKAAEEKAKKEAQEAAKKEAQEAAKKEKAQEATEEEQAQLEIADIAKEIEQLDERDVKILEEVLDRYGDMSEATKKLFEQYSANQKQEIDISELSGEELCDLLSGFQYMKMNSDAENYFENVNYSGDKKETVESMVEKLSQSYNDGKISEDEYTEALASISFTMDKYGYVPGDDDIKYLAKEQLGEDFDFTKFDTQRKVYENKEERISKEIKDIEQESALEKQKELEEVRDDFKNKIYNYKTARHYGVSSEKLAELEPEVQAAAEADLKVRLESFGKSIEDYTELAEGDELITTLPDGTYVKFIKQGEEYKLDGLSYRPGDIDFNDNAEGEPSQVELAKEEYEQACKNYDERTNKASQRKMDKKQEEFQKTTEEDFQKRLDAYGKNLDDIFAHAEGNEQVIKLEDGTVAKFIKQDDEWILDAESYIEGDKSTIDIQNQKESEGELAAKDHNAKMVKRYQGTKEQIDAASAQCQKQAEEVVKDYGKPIATTITNNGQVKYEDYENGKRVKFVLEDGEWKVDADYLKKQIDTSYSSSGTKVVNNENYANRIPQQRSTSSAGKINSAFKTVISSRYYTSYSSITQKASTTLSNILKSINNGTYKSNITSRYNSVSSNSNNSKKSSVIGKAAGSIKSILKSGIDSIKNFVKNSSTKKSTDTKAEAANNKIDTKNIKAKTSYSPKTGNQNLGDLSTNKEQLEGSIESTQNALESVQDGNNELMQSAEQNLQDSIDAYKDALNFKDSEMYQEMQDAIDAFDESISQENQNILQCQEGIRDIDNNISLQAKGITKLDDAIRGYQSNIDALQSQLRSVRGTDAEREINKSIEKLESLKKAAQKQQDIMEENCQELTSQRKVLNDQILESRSNIKKFNDDKLNMKNKMESIGNELVQNAQKNLSLSKEYLDNTRRQISQQLEAQIADYESQLSNVEDKITDFGQNLSGVADNKDKTDEAIKAAQSPDDISKQNALQNSKMNNIYTKQPDTPSQSSVNNNATIQNPNNTGFSYDSAMQIDKNIASDLSANIGSAEDIQRSVSAVRDTISYESIGLSDIQKDMANNAIVFGELAQEQMKLRQTDISELSQDEARELKNKLDDIENKIDDLIQKQNELAAKEELQRKILARQQVNEESLKARYSDLYVQNQVSYDALAQEARKQKKNKENKEAQ